MIDFPNSHSWKKEDIEAWTRGEVRAILDNVGKTDTEMQATGKEAVGSLKSVIASDGKAVLYRKQENGRWAKNDSSADKWGLTNDGEDASISGMENSATTPKSTLIPNAAAYLDNSFNVLLIALHGVGKTVSIMDLARERGMKFKYFSCSTLDPFTDLVGVPTPRDYCPECKSYFRDQPKCPDCDTRTIESLQMIRPREVDEAEIIFFDEFNRADTKTQNALFEIMQFKTINGEPLPNLKACWAAINPPNDEQNYTVEQIDPALLDRFDIYVELTPKVSVDYMARHMPKQIAAQLAVWWNQHQEAIKSGSKDATRDYISPRRLEKIGLVWCATKNQRSVMAAIPTEIAAEKRKLVDLLKKAQAEVDKANGDDPADYEEPTDPNYDGSGLGDAPAPQFTYRLAAMRLDQEALAEYLRDNPLHKPTHDRVAAELSSRVGGEDLVLKFGKIIDGLHAPILEGMIASFPEAKTRQMRKGFLQLHKDKASEAEGLKNLYKMLSANATEADWPKL